ncbi:MAG: amino acid adenylation domain-containing protein [Azospirillaceae bacterium]|nr:amino acid adenylation domain-containing protein [Azospirillaceae bacterium]
MTGSLASLAIAGGGTETALPAPVGLEAEGEGSFLFPASFAQERLWFLDQFDPGSAVYLLPNNYCFQGPVDAGALARALNEIVRRHEALRTHFVRIEGAVMQAVVPQLDIPLPQIDLRGLPDGIRDAEFHRIVALEATRPFDLATGPLLRATLVTVGDAARYLLLTLHHIVSDAWSSEILYRELTALYGAYIAGLPSSLPDLPIQYGDFAHWQRQLLTGGVLDDHMRYWRRQLDGAPALLELPADRPRGPTQGFRGASIHFALPDAVTARLKAIAREENATVFMVLLAAFTALLHRYTGQNDLVVGSPIANRGRAEIEELIGFFVNTLVLRVRFAGDPGFRQLLRHVRDVTLEAYAHQDLPFEKLVHELRPPRHASHNPLFQVMFVHQVAAAAADAGGADADFISQPVAGTAKFDLTLFITEAGPRLTAAIEFNTDLFDAARIMRLIGYFRTLLGAVAQAPDQPVSALALLPPAEAALLGQWNATSHDYGTAQTVAALFEAQAARQPAAAAVISGGQTLSYGDLNRRANRLAHHLRRLGVGDETRVGFCLRRSADLAVALLAVLKSGGAYVPLDPTYPRERLAFIVGDSGMAVVISDDNARDALPPLDVPLLSFSRDAAAIMAEPDHNPSDGSLADAGPAADPDRLAYVIYTSGSTGRPKGVAMAQRALFNLLQWQVAHSRLPGEARTLQFTSPNFDVSFQEIFSTWCGGGTLVMVDDDTRLEPGQLLRAIAEGAVARLFIPPVVLTQLAVADAAATVDLSALRQVIVAGEALHLTPAITAFFARWPGASLHNHYGPTETHLATAFTLAGPPAGWPVLPPIGYPIANVQTHILDRRLQPVPPGGPGELYIGGIGLARGYLGRPDLTADRFVPDPFSGVPGARLYRTGDLVRHAPSGDIEFLGRADDQVKIRGFRVEPGEVRAALLRHPAVRDCAVVLRPDHQEGGASLAAYLTLRPELTVTTADLRRTLAATLPDYMIPSNFVVLDALPLLPNGKLDRNALPAPDAARPDLDQDFVAPATPTEMVLADLWAEVLRLDRVGVQDNFFDLGGHSLLATQVVSRIRERLRVDLPLRRLFDAPTVAELAVAIDGLAGEGGSAATAPAFDPPPLDGPQPEELLARLAQLSDAEVETLLAGL